MLRAGALIAGLAAAGLAAATAQERVTWKTDSDNQTCEASTGPLVIETRNGIDFALGFIGLKIGRQKVREIDFGDQGAIISEFSQVKKGAGTILDGTGAHLLSQAATVSIRWTDQPHLTVPVAGVGGIMAGLQRCAEGLEVKRAEAARKRAEFAAKMGAAAAILGSGSRSSGAGGGVCFKESEWTSGFNRNCVYNCTGSQAVQTIGSAELCPLTINR